MKFDIVNIENKKVGQAELSDTIFGAKWNSNLVKQVMVAQLANKREPIAHAKGRGEVSGGGKKPWKQKGTGRARQGSNRSPIWVGGGVSHGPVKERDFSQKVNKKMKTAALFSVISKKLKDNEILIVDQFQNVGNKTKDWANVLKNLTDRRSRTLMILENGNRGFSKAISNLPKIDTISPLSLNVYDLLKSKKIILESKAIEEMTKQYVS